MRSIFVLTFISIFTIYIGCKQGERLSSPEHYILKKSHTERTKVDSPADFRVEIIPTDGFKMEVEAPIKLIFKKEMNPDIEFEKEIYTKDDLINKDIKRPIFNGRFIPKKEGIYNIK
ncbi:MAG: hypothetical protein ACP5KG_04565, partial [Myxococcota bacterium]